MGIKTLSGVLLTGIGLLLGGVGHAAEEGKAVIEYRAAKIRLFNEAGQPVGQIERDKLPALPTPVLAESGNGLVKIGAPGQEVWLSPMSVKFNKTADLLSECEQVARLKSTNTQKGYVSRGLSECQE